MSFVSLATGMVLATLLIALVVVRAAIAYAHRRGMMDLPGQRRSHTIPTPRGGGIGIVVAVLLTMPICLAALPGPLPPVVVGALAVGTVLVAAVGWWDDHASLPVLPRFGIQLLSAGLLAVSLALTGMSWWWVPVLMLAGGWSINLHNFMDGIDGLLAQQVIFVGLGLALLAWAAVQPALAVAAACLAAAALGFWWFNRPRARIFMGDVGSGTMGLLVFALTALLWRADWHLLWPALILSSSFVADASLTLLRRMVGGRRWYTAHREHLYQWMVRSGFTHATGGACYLGWNMLVAAPLAFLAWARPMWSVSLFFGTYLIATTVWIVMKRRCVRRVWDKGRHVAT
ncbi:MraY family glycosyltransferase [Dyella japonica]|uniref:Glycosyl transferase family 4 n=1 Tax=Dyella japonica A8 TaxID=1217721 RepID=A0A075K6U3_9GAMM|nr:glycosyltransferase family 4 protein [Dyella japonica]AIF47858.1 glycosyl transferase family 4 [Dyella japonica A8]